MSARLPSGEVGPGIPVAEAASVNPSSCPPQPTILGPHHQYPSGGRLSRTFDEIHCPSQDLFHPTFAFLLTPVALSPESLKGPAALQPGALARHRHPAEATCSPPVCARKNNVSVVRELRIPGVIGTITGCSVVALQADGGSRYPNELPSEASAVPIRYLVSVSPVTTKPSRSYHLRALGFSLSTCNVTGRPCARASAMRSWTILVPKPRPWKRARFPPWREKVSLLFARFVGLRRLGHQTRRCAV